MFIVRVLEKNELIIVNNLKNFEIINPIQNTYISRHSLHFACGAAVRLRRRNEETRRLGLRQAGNAGADHERSDIWIRISI